jgi:hypothetical protein
MGSVLARCMDLCLCSVVATGLAVDRSLYRLAQRQAEKKNRTKQDTKNAENMFKHRIEIWNERQKAIPGQSHIVPEG